MKKNNLVVLTLYECFSQAQNAFESKTTIAMVTVQI
jgi:hypothetical protein